MTKIVNEIFEEFEKNFLIENGNTPVKEYVEIHAFLKDSLIRVLDAVETDYYYDGHQDTIKTNLRNLQEEIRKVA